MFNYISNTFVVLALALIIPFFFPRSEKSVSLNTLPSAIKSWHERGSYINIFGYKTFYIHEKSKNLNKVNSTYALVHGFPTSSYDYHSVIEELLNHGNVVVHDQVGFGFSDKPTDFTYSVLELAEHCLELYRKLNVQGEIVLVGHDMGDSVVMEILTRHHRKMLPGFNFSFSKFVFTNGGMNYERANLRISQSIVSSPIFGPFFNAWSVNTGLSDIIGPIQLSGIYSPKAEASQVKGDVESMALLYSLKGGHKMFYKLIYYLNDRINFEFRWYPALVEISKEIPVKLVWGNEDAVAPMKIANFIKSLNYEDIELNVIENCGHFSMLEAPQKWLNYVIN